MNKGNWYKCPEAQACFNCLRFTLGLFVAAWLFGCTSITPYENFKTTMNASLGTIIDDIPAYQFGGSGLIDETHLPNGNLSHRYRYKNPYGTCIYIFEIDSKSHRIIAWQVEGEDKACILIP